MQLARQWWALLKIYFQEGIAYPAQALLWILTDGITAVTMPLVFVAATRARGPIEGFDQSGFVLYYLCFLMINSFVQSHFMWEIGQEIKEGQFSVFLVRPFSYYQFMLIRNLAWRGMRVTLTIPLAVSLWIAYHSLLGNAHPHLSVVFWVAVILGHFVSLAVVMAMAMLALFVQETTSIFELYYVPMLFLSGQLFPVAVLPAWASTISKWMPFYYTSGLPAEIVIGRVQPTEAWPMVLAQIGWIAAGYCAHKVLWRSGLKQYSGVGM